MKATPGYLFTEFTNQEFAAVCKYASDLGVLEWKNKDNGQLFVTKHEQIADFIRKRARSK